MNSITSHLVRPAVGAARDHDLASRPTPTGTDAPSVSNALRQILPPGGACGGAPRLGVNPRTVQEPVPSLGCGFWNAREQSSFSEVHASPFGADPGPAAFPIEPDGGMTWTPSALWLALRLAC